MMKNITLDIRTRTFAPTDQLLFDTNIWMYIYGPRGNPDDWKSRVYSGALAKALKVNSALFTEILILSEFINRYARLEHQIQVNKGAAPGDYKQFRNSPAFLPVAQRIAGDVRRILRHCKRIESGFEALDIAAMVDEYERGAFDFNDQVLASLCQSRGLALVTHDADFKDRGLSIITANTRLLV